MEALRVLAVLRPLVLLTLRVLSVQKYDEIYRYQVSVYSDHEVWWAHLWYVLSRSAAVAQGCDILYISHGELQQQR